MFANLKPIVVVVVGIFTLEQTVLTLLSSWISLLLVVDIVVILIVDIVVFVVVVVFIFNPKQTALNLPSLRIWLLLLLTVLLLFLLLLW